MTHVTVSLKYQIVIPKDVWRQVPLKIGQRLAIVVEKGLITLLPDRPLASLKGCLKDMKTGEIRQKRDRF